MNNKNLIGLVIIGLIVIFSNTIIYQNSGRVENYDSVNQQLSTVIEELEKQQKLLNNNSDQLRTNSELLGEQANLFELLLKKKNNDG